MCVYIPNIPKRDNETLLFPEKKPQPLGQHVIILHRFRNPNVDYKQNLIIMIIPLYSIQHLVLSFLNGYMYLVEHALPLDTILYFKSMKFPYLTYYLTSLAQACFATLKPIQSVCKQSLRVLDRNTLPLHTQL